MKQKNQDVGGVGDGVSLRYSYENVQNCSKDRGKCSTLCMVTHIAEYGSTR